LILQIPEILIHPWLTANHPTCDTPDSGVVILTPPLPPSPSELAQPIASLEDIDQELLGSLKIIWGKHADPDGENIIRDLCSPPGFGVHAKAFYFLLGRYREETMQKRLTEGAGDYQDLSRPSQVGEQRILRIYRPKTHTLPPFQRSSPALLTTSQLTQSPCKESAPTSCQVPASPVGPRPPPVYSSRYQAEAWRNQFQQDFSPDPPHTSTPPPRPISVFALGRGGPRPQPPRRGTFTGTSEIPSLGFAQHLHNLQDASRYKSQGSCTTAAIKGRSVSKGKNHLVLEATAPDTQLITKTQQLLCLLHPKLQIQYSNIHSLKVLMV